MILALAAITNQETATFDCGQQTVGGINILSCSGTIGLMPITVHVHHLSVLSHNEIELLEGSLNDLSILEGSPIEILDEVKADVIDELEVEVDQVTVCTTLVSGPLCTE